MVAKNGHNQDKSMVVKNGHSQDNNIMAKMAIIKTTLFCTKIAKSSQCYDEDNGHNQEEQELKMESHDIAVESYLGWKYPPKSIINIAVSCRIYCCRHLKIV